MLDPFHALILRAVDRVYSLFAPSLSSKLSFMENGKRNSFNESSPVRERKNKTQVFFRFVLSQGNASGKFRIDPDNMIKGLEQKTN